MIYARIMYNRNSFSCDSLSVIGSEPRDIATGII